MSEHEQTTNSHASKVQRSLVLLYGAVAYLGFHAVFLYMVAFLNGFPVLNAMDGPQSSPLPLAVAINVGLVALFGLQHAVMARPAFKRAWTRVVPAEIERSTFVIATVLVLFACMLAWQPIAGSVYHVSNTALRYALYALQAVGWGVLVYATFLIDHFELFGLRQVWCHAKQRALPVQEFRSPSMYRYSRHPMMIGVLMGFWMTPDMSAGRLLWAAAFTVYIAIGIRLEERDLVAHLGGAYLRYQRTVPRLIPWKRPAGARTQESVRV